MALLSQFLKGVIDWFLENNHNKNDKNYALQCINLNRKMPISIRYGKRKNRKLSISIMYGKNVKFENCISQLGMEKCKNCKMSISIRYGKNAKCLSQLCMEKT